MANCHSCGGVVASLRAAHGHKCLPRKGASTPTVAVAPKPRPGSETEHALYFDLSMRWPEIKPKMREDVEMRNAWMRQMPFGAFLTPPRGFQFDAAFPARMLAIDVDGAAHAAGRKKQKSDTERRGLAAAAGWRVLTLTPEQVRAGTAMRLVTEALT